MLVSEGPFQRRPLSVEKIGKFNTAGERAGYNDES